MQKPKFFWITGASAVGKSTLAQSIYDKCNEIYTIDLDDLLRGDDWQTKKDNALRVVYSLNNHVKKIIIFGTITDKQLLACKKLNDFSSGYVIALTIDADEQYKRLKDRGWKEEDIKFQVDLNRYFEESRLVSLQNIQWEVLNVSNLDLSEISEKIISWHAERLTDNN